MRSARGTFSGRLGFYMAAIGAGLSLGNLWRFPYLTGKNGGGAFVLLYVFFVAAVALPLLISELMLGKITRKSIVGALASPKIAPQASRRWSIFGKIGILASIVVLSYYAVVSGWVIHFIVQGFMGAFTSGPLVAGQIFDHLYDRGALQVGLMSIHLILTTFIVGRGIQNGIERWTKVFMPLFLIMLGGLVIHSLFMPGSVRALRFLFYPDFTQLTRTAVIEALGHAFFTLSLGFGAMTAYGSYLKPGSHIPTEGVYLAGIDTLLSICAGLLIFPIVFSANLGVDSGPSLLFKTMPVLFATISVGSWLGVTFFILLYFAALSSSIALFEGVVAYLIDEKGMPRKKAAAALGFTSFVLAIISALSGTVLRNIRIGDRGLLEIFDQIFINWSVPIVGFGIALFMGWVVSEKAKAEEFIDQRSLSSERLFPTWIFAIRWLAPIVLISMFILQIITSFSSGI